MSLKYSLSESSVQYSPTYPITPTRFVQSQRGLHKYKIFWSGQKPKCKKCKTIWETWFQEFQRKHFSNYRKLLKLFLLILKVPVNPTVFKSENISAFNISNITNEIYLLFPKEIVTPMFFVGFFCCQLNVLRNQRQL